jgi:hypothetical protein
VSCQCQGQKRDMPCSYAYAMNLLRERNTETDRFHYLELLNKLLSVKEDQLSMFKDKFGDF